MAQPRKELSLFDSTSIIVGIIIGVGIYETAPTIAGAAGSAWLLLLLWLVGGLLSFCGALCYAELAHYCPQDGGDYVYLREAYGPLAAFLFGWAQALIIRPGSIAAMAFPAARYLEVVFSPELPQSLEPHRRTLYAVLIVLGLTLLNMAGVRSGKRTQNLLSALKVAGLLAIGCAVFFPTAGLPLQAAPSELNFSLAMILVLFTYGGWSEIAYVAAEVKDPARNILRSLLWGTGLVTMIYILLNGTFLTVLGYAGVVNSQAVASDTLGAVFCYDARVLVAGLITVSALGAVNGLTLTGSRIYYAVGKDLARLNFMGRWDDKRGAPVVSLLIQACITSTIVVWSGSFNRTVVYTTTVVWLFYFLVALALPILRRRIKADLSGAAFRLPGYPVTLIAFGASCIFLVQGALRYDLGGSLMSLLVLLVGVPVYFMLRA
jgi:basic amino acid/polyamine antiporter, APA family